MIVADETMATGKTVAIGKMTATGDDSSRQGGGNAHSNIVQ